MSVMSCRGARRRLSAYHDGELSTPNRSPSRRTCGDAGGAQAKRRRMPHWVNHSEDVPRGWWRSMTVISTRCSRKSSAG